MSWLKLTVETEQARAEDVSDFLEQFGASAVSFSAASDDKIFAEPGEETGELWQRTEVSSLLPADIDMDILLVCLKERIGTEGLFERRIEAIQDQDWVEVYRNSQQAMVFADRICICPSWLEPPASELEPIILDPGLAFGTGTHATTSLCLEWLACADVAGKAVLDFGCGSGILALAAARLKAEKIYAVDIDPLAVTATEQNAVNNQLNEQLLIGLPDELDIPEVDIVLANVLLNPLLNLSAQLAAYVRRGGNIVLSGILATQADECLAAYSEWFNMQTPVFNNEWAMIHGVRR